MPVKLIPVPKTPFKSVVKEPIILFSIIAGPSELMPITLEAPSD